MAPQIWIFRLYLVLAAVVCGVFLLVAWSTRRPREVEPGAVQRLRFAFFVLLSLILLSALGFTLTRMPYTLWAEEVPDRVVFIVGKQFAFAISEDPVESDEAWQAATQAPPVELPAGGLVEFRVSSLDVNHGVGFYDPDGVLLGQVQGMPGYVNRLRLRLDRPGRYDVLCLELCGNLHSGMRGVLQVKQGI